jgi:putative CocE/NonD family hydrolase
LPPADGAASELRFDPLDPLPTVSANTSSLYELLAAPARVDLDTPLVLHRSLVTMGGSDQRTRPGIFGARAPYGPLADRADVLAFESAPLERDLEVTGPVEAELSVSTDVPDTDIFVMLLDLYPPSAEWPQGYRLNISDGLLRLRYREGLDDPHPLLPGGRYRVTVPLYPTANRFVAGHRIGLWVSSSSFPRFDVNPNTGEPLGRHTHTRVARTRVHHEAAAPSLVRLPVLPA